MIACNAQMHAHIWMHCWAEDEQWNILSVVLSSLTDLFSVLHKNNHTHTHTNSRPSKHTRRHSSSFQRALTLCCWLSPCRGDNVSWTKLSDSTAYYTLSSLTGPSPKYFTDFCNVSEVTHSVSFPEKHTRGKCHQCWHLPSQKSQTPASVLKPHQSQSNEHQRRMHGAWRKNNGRTTTTPQTS